MAAGCHDIIERMDRIDDLESIQSEFESYIRSLGFDTFAYITIRPPAGLSEPYFATTYPEDWKRRYGAEDYELIDPALSKSACTTLPFRWDGIYAVGNLSKRQQRIFDEAKECGIANGLTIPLHGPESGLAVLNLGTSLSASELEKIWRKNCKDIVFLVSYTHERIVRNSFANAKATGVVLSDRERECLAWTAAGKTTWEVSQILGISKETVISHLKNAMRKLGVYSKHHAVVKAIVHGLISI